MGIDGKRMISYSGGIQTHWREPAPATKRIRLRIRNERHIVSGWYRIPGGEWVRHQIRYETSGYHVNTVGDLQSLRPALYAFGDGAVRFGQFVYRPLP
jgi:xylan 1,4-beta-xylosidase